MSADASAPDEHALDVFRHMLAWRRSGVSAALAVVARVEGGGLRQAGALMAVSEHGARAGYLSSGCMDQDAALHAVQSLRDGCVKHLRYGADSPFVDIRLPCGGVMDVLIAPAPDADVIAAAAEALSARRPVRLEIGDGGALRLLAPDAEPSADALLLNYAPKLRLRIAGRGAECLALARLAHAAGVEVALHVASDEDAEAAARAGWSFTRLHTPHSLPPEQDDAWTAFVLMFHDADWEAALLQRALAGPAFYVGAVGSKATHARRCARLLTAGCAPHRVARVRGPIGLAPSMRDASMLGVSVLAEVVRDFHTRNLAAKRRTGLLLLAAGAASRFSHGDKLLADLGGARVLSYAAQMLEGEPMGARLAVVAPGQDARREELSAHGWSIVENPDAASGMASSLRAGLHALEADASIDQVLIVLGDMPFVPGAHLEALLEQPRGAAVMSGFAEVTSPPALFPRESFAALSRLHGDAGAKSVFERWPHKCIVPIESDRALDIDAALDLELARHWLEGQTPERKKSTQNLREQRP